MTARPFDLGVRLLEFAVAVGRLVAQLPAHRLGAHLAGQLLRSGTAPAAHHAEAQGAESRRDFVHKLKLGLKELRESLFWLQFAQRMEVGEAEQLEKCRGECQELIAIFVRSIQTANKRTSNVQNGTSNRIR